MLSAEKIEETRIPFHFEMRKKNLLSFHKHSQFPCRVLSPLKFRRMEVSMRSTTGTSTFPLLAKALSWYSIGGFYSTFDPLSGFSNLLTVVGQSMRWTVWSCLTFSLALWGWKFAASDDHTGKCKSWKLLSKKLTKRVPSAKLHIFRTLGFKDKSWLSFYKEKDSLFPFDFADFCCKLLQVIYMRPVVVDTGCLLFFLRIIHYQHRDGTHTNWQRNTGNLQKPKIYYYPWDRKHTNSDCESNFTCGYLWYCIIWRSNCFTLFKL